MKRGPSRRPRRTKLPGTTGGVPPAGGYYPPLHTGGRAGPNSAPAPSLSCRGGYQPPAARCPRRALHMRRSPSRCPQRAELPGTTGGVPPAGGYYPPLRTGGRADPSSAPAPPLSCRGGYQPPAARCLYRVPHMRRGPSRCPRRTKLPGTTGHTPGGRILSAPTRQRKGGPGQCAHSASFL